MDSPTGEARDIEVLILGSGTSAGIPVIACDCAVCRSDDPRDRRTRASAAVRFLDVGGQERVVLLDTSPDLREQALRENLRRCDAILYTHEHMDHTFGLDEVRRFNAVMRQSIDLWAERLTMEHLERVYGYIFRKEHNVNPSFVASLVPHQIEDLRPIDLFGLRFRPLRLLHGELPIVGYRIEALDAHGQVASVQPAPLPFAYLTDVSTIPDETWAFLADLRHVVLDLLRYEPHPTHLSADEAIELAARIGAGSTWFTHMTHDIAHADLDARLPEGLHLAWDGLAIK